MKKNTKDYIVGQNIRMSIAGLKMKSRKTMFRIYVLAALSLPFLMWGQDAKPQDYGIKSKKALDLYQEGTTQAQMRDRARACLLFREALALEPDFAQALFELGINEYFQKHFAEALEPMEKAARLDSVKYSGYYLAEVRFYNGKYNKAIPQYKQFLEPTEGMKQSPSRKEIVEQAQRNYRHASFAANALQDTIRFVPQNMGPGINSEGEEYLPFLTADDGYLLFTSRRPGNAGGYNPALQDYAEDFYYSSYKNNSWISARNLGEPINTERNEGAASVTPDGNLILYTVCEHPQGLGSCDLFYSRRVGDKWSEPKNLGKSINSVYWDSQPCLSHDGTTLYFTSNRPGGKGGRDIWYSSLVDNKWTEAKNLGIPVNTKGNEGSPFIHANGQTLYFSSDQHPGFGANDLFMSQIADSGWSVPKNLGYPLNTIAEESNIFVNAKGTMGFINSNRPGGLGKSDLYFFELDSTIRPQLLATFLRGVVRDSSTRKPLVSRIRIIDVDSRDTVRTIYSQAPAGNFLTSLPLEREYAAYVEAKGYLFASKHFYLKEPATGLYFDLMIDMIPIKIGAEVVLNNIFFETNKYTLKESSNAELLYLLNYLKVNPKLQVEIQGHTDDVGADKDNLLLSKRRAESVRDYLVAKGIPPERLIAKGYGESKPLKPNDSDANRAQNRRTSFRVLGVE